jgi:hypothetical protein
MCAPGFDNPKLVEYNERPHGILFRVVDANDVVHNFFILTASQKARNGKSAITENEEDFWRLHKEVNQ